jgi:MFS family permease
MFSLFSRVEHWPTSPALRRGKAGLRGYVSTELDEAPLNSLGLAAQVLLTTGNRRRDKVTKTTCQSRSMPALNRNVAVLSGTVFLFIVAWSSWYLILPLHLRNLGATDAQVGLAYTLMHLGYQGMQLLGGLLTDRFGRKNVIVWPTFAYLPLYLLAAATHKWGLLVVLLVVADSLGAVQWPAFMASIAESVSEAQRGSAFAVFEFAVGLGMALGPAAGAVLLTMGGIPLLMGGTGLVASGCAVARWLWLRETTHRSNLPGLGDWRRLLSGRLRQFLAAASLFSLLMSVTIYGPFISLHAKDVGGLSEQGINSLMAAVGVVATLAGLAGGRMIRWLGARRALQLGILAHTGALLPWAYAPAALMGQSFLLASWVGMQLSSIAYQTTLSEQASDESRGSVVGLVGTVTGMVAAVGPMLGAWLREAFGAVGPFWGALLLSLLVVGLLRRGEPLPASAE